MTDIKVLNFVLHIGDSFWQYTNNPLSIRDKTETSRDKTGTSRDKTGTSMGKTGTAATKKGQ